MVVYCFRQRLAPNPRAFETSSLPKTPRHPRNILWVGHSCPTILIQTKRSHLKRNKPTQNPSSASSSHLLPFSRNFFLTKRSHRSALQISSLKISPLHSPPSAQRPFLVPRPSSLVPKFVMNTISHPQPRRTISMPATGKISQVIGSTF